MESGRQDVELASIPSFSLPHVLVDFDKPLHEQGSGVGEAVIDDVDVEDALAPHHQGQTNVPIRLVASTEDSDCAYMAAAGDEACRGKSGAEGC